MAAYSGAWALSARVAAASAAVLAVALALKLAAPSVAEFARVQIPLLWLSLLSWLEPPYIYLVINGIIFTIAASSRLHSVEEEEEEFVISRSAWTPTAKRTSSPEVPAERLSAPEKPLVSSRFVHRRPSKASPEALGVIKPKRQETLENTWKAITNGRLRKSETWGENDNRDPLDQPPARPAMRKSETFKDLTNELASPSPPSASPGKASPSQDELNRRVEAFIRKFNEEMRLQRQESLNQYKAMMS